MSGVLEAASQVTQGIDVFKDNITSKITRRLSALLSSLRKRVQGGLRFRV